MGFGISEPKTLRLSREGGACEKGLSVVNRSGSRDRLGFRREVAVPRQLVEIIGICLSLIVIFASQ